MNIWTKTYHLLKNNHTLYLLTVVESKGSAPGRRGFKMLVIDNGELFGSIGGGIMEFNMVEKAKTLLDKDIIQQSTYTQVHRGDAQSSSGMICSGSQTIAFNYLSKDDLMWVGSCIQSSQMLEFSHKGIKSIDIENDEHCFIKFKDVWSYSELINQHPVAHIFGAGHVSVTTSLILTQLGFKVYLYDNRENINTFDDNQTVFSKSLVDYHKLSERVKINANDHVLLMTHKFTEDKILLAQLLDNKLKYLGVLGSNNKISVLFKALIKEGFSQSQLDKVKAPIGLNINSQTTQEIAVSIAAEIIQMNRK